MKHKIVYLIYSVLFVSCVDKVERICDLEQYTVEYYKMQEHLIDTVLVYPQSINVFKDKLLVMDPQRDFSKIAVLDRNQFDFLFSGINRGRTKSEVVNLICDYYACTDTSFFVLDDNIEKEYCLHDNHIRYVGHVSITIPDALNQLLRVGEEKYITLGLTSGEGYEHFLYEKGTYQGFGYYPEYFSETKNNFVLNGKMSAGMVGKDRIWDFYVHRNLIRSYDLEGNLVNGLLIKDSTRKIQNVKDMIHELYYYKINWNRTYILVVYDANDNGKNVQELQLWTWDGELKRRVRFDKHFDFYALSEDNIFYAMNVNKPNVIYTYDFDE